LSAFIEFDSQNLIADARRPTAALRSDGIRDPAREHDQRAAPATFVSVPVHGAGGGSEPAETAAAPSRCGVKHA
jgi:hypothetical protein